ncbi:MAG TPA: phosphate ABC transporter permease PstA [Pirellulaceae bacterium]|nr:phosphate ABC transporter permease PstA [Pirellulaceae bacterium]
MNDVARLITFRKRQDRAFQVVGGLCTLIGVVTLVALLVKLAIDGFPLLARAGTFLLSNASYDPADAGILMAWVGSLCVMVVTFLTAVPLGVAAAVYLEEYARRNWVTDLIEVNISNLAGVPSITYGLMALWLFTYLLGLSSSILVGGLTLSLLILPIIIVATREALRSIPNAIREAAYASGATKWQTIWYHMLPYSLGGIATGTIIAMSRAVGETAPLIVIGAAGWVSNLPPPPLTSRFPYLNGAWLHSDFTVLPVQMFTWTADPDPAFQANAAAAGLVLIAFTLTMNAVAIVVRYRVRQRIKW